MIQPLTSVQHEEIRELQSRLSKLIQFPPKYLQQFETFQAILQLLDLDSRSSPGPISIQNCDSANIDRCFFCLVIDFILDHLCKAPTVSHLKASSNGSSPNFVACPDYLKILELLIGKFQATSMNISIYSYILLP